MARRSKAQLAAAINALLTDTGANYAILPSELAAILLDSKDSLLAEPAVAATDGDVLTMDGSTEQWDKITVENLTAGIAAQLVEDVGNDGTSLTISFANGEVTLSYTDGAGDTRTATAVALPTANNANAGIVQLHGDIGENDTNDSQAVTARKVNERIDGRILRGSMEERQALVGQVLEVDSQGAVSTGAKGTGPKGDAGDAGASAAIFGTRYYQTTNSATPPAAPTSASDADWSTSLTPPSASSRYAWQAIGVGTGTLSTFADVDVWLILPAGIFASSGGGSTPPAQNHRIYVAYGATEAQTAFVTADASAAGRSANNEADTSLTEVVTPALAAGQNRHYAIYLPSDKRLSVLHVDGDTTFNYARGFTLVTNPATVTLPPSTAYVVYVSDNPLNYGGETFDITTRDA